MAQLKIRGVKSFSAERDICFDLSNKVTLIYGQNGSGKSTVSGYFYSSQRNIYRHCSFDSPHVSHFQVFNQEYIDEKFASTGNQQGIFTLSEANKESQDKITANNKESIKLGSQIDKLKEEISENKDKREELIDICEKNIFNRTANDRKRLENFLEGAKVKKTFYKRMDKTPLSTIRFSTEELEKKWQALCKSEGNFVSELNIPLINGLPEDIEKIMQEPVIPASSTQFSALVQKMGNADWVHQGRDYVHDDTCPFCQQSFDVAKFNDEINKMFEETYQESLEALSHTVKSLHQDYDNYEAFEHRVATHVFVDEDSNILSLVKGVKKSFHRLQQQVSNKRKEPSIVIKPENIQDQLLLLQNEFKTFNSRVCENNRLAHNFSQEKQKISDDVMAHLRWICDDYLNDLNRQLDDLQKEVDKKNKEVQSLHDRKKYLDDETSTLTEQLSDIQPTINIINTKLMDLGITDFEIICHDEEMKLYRLRRKSEPKKTEVFNTLSEGEKTIISFLYFIESCTGNLTPKIIHRDNKLIVIDDPISSLSHNYIYEVAAIIKSKLINAGAAKHVVILTHNMFFFQEILLNSGRLQDNRKAPANWSLLRIVKYKYSSCEQLSMHEMLNEYQALWQTLKDVRDGKTQPVVMYNTMRNILEYYFSFACKNEKLRESFEYLANKHSEPEQYYSFYRAINRHSHSDGRNILPTGNIDEKRYLNMFRKIFEHTGDEEHYLAMMDEPKEHPETGD